MSVSSDLDAEFDVDWLPNALLIVDWQGVIHRINRQWVSLYGYTHALTLGKELNEFLHPQDIIRLQYWMEEAMEEQSTTNLVLRFIDAAGIDRWSDVYLQPIKHKDFGGIVITVSDISERVGKEQLLLAQQRSINTILDDLPGMVYRCRNSPEWPMEYVSANCLELTGYDANDIIRNRKVSYGSLIISEDAEDVWEEVQNGVRERRRFELVYRLRTATGALKWVWELGNGIFSEDGELSGIEGIIIDFNRQVMHRTTGLRRGMHSEVFVDVARFKTALISRLEQSASNASEVPRIYCIKLDRYENYMAGAGFNQLYRGHTYVSELLKEIAGDNGLVMSPKPDRWYVFSNNRITIEDEVRRIEEAFFNPIQLNGRQLYVSVSIGCAAIEDRSADLDHILHEAKQAMVYCSQTGGGSSHISVM